MEEEGYLQPFGTSSGLTPWLMAWTWRNKRKGVAVRDGRRVRGVNRSQSLGMMVVGAVSLRFESG